MRTAPDLRYTDRDVREDLQLKLHALRYLASYGGEFDPLVRAQNMLEMDGDLTVPMTRTVLNCMRAEGVDLPAPRGLVLPQRIRQPEPEERRPRVVRVGGRLKYDYLINLHKQAKWFHKIDHARTELEFYPADWWDVDRRNTVVVRRARGVCGKDLDAYWWSRRQVVLGDLVDAQDSGNLPCPGCTS